MITRPTKTLSVALAVALLSPGLTPYAAAANIVSVPVSAAGGVLAAGVAGAGLRSANFTPNLLPAVGTLPTLSVAPAPSLITVIGRTAVAAPHAVLGVTASAIATAEPIMARPASAFSAPSAQAAQAKGTLVTLDETVNMAAPKGVASESVGLRTGRMFDGLTRRGAAIADAPAVAGRVFDSRPSSLGRANLADAPKPTLTTPEPARQSNTRRVALTATAVALAVGLLFAAPMIAMLAPVATAGAGVSVLTLIHPAASALAAVAGAVYGLIAAHPKGGPAPSAGEVMASVLRYGVLAGAGAYVLLDLTQALFLGFPAAGLSPLPTAVATAALGQSAFQGKFVEPTTSTADRLMGSFPAIAGALGLSLGVALFSPSLLLTATVGAMSATGVAAAVYSAFYKPGLSAANGPALMARGYVMQTLMTGLALAVTGPYLMAPFLLMAAWGFWDVITTAFMAVAASLAESYRNIRRK